MLYIHRKMDQERIIIIRSGIPETRKKPKTVRVTLSIPQNLFVLITPRPAFFGFSTNNHLMVMLFCMG